MTDRDLLKQALEALELLAKYENPSTKIQVRKPIDGGPIVTMYPHKVATEAAAPLRERLAQPEQEPVMWTPVSTTMPKSGVTVLACYKNSHGKVRRIRAKWVPAKTQEAYGDDEWGEYDEEADIYWTPEGWYECIDNWDEYSSVFVGEGEVTHWMPMPPDPYTTPRRREWVGLTRGEIAEILCDDRWQGRPEYMLLQMQAKLKEKNS